MTLLPRSQTTNFQHRSSDFTLCIFREDNNRIVKLVSKIPYAETGGNLFGLWTNQGNPVVLVATGPGKNCKRSSASFYQDIPYMQRVGNSLTGNYPLCHIGEWHSHHQMQLYQPSYGDCNTVQRNYPTGSQGFVLMIANILQNGTVKLSPYKFTDERSPYQSGDIEVITVENPFMKVRQITSAIENGKEEIPQQHLSRTVTERECQGDRNSYISELQPNDLEKRAKRGDSSHQRRQNSRSRSRSPIKKNGYLSPEEEPDIDYRTRRFSRQGPATSETAAPSCRSYDKPQQSSTARNITTSGQETFSTRNLTNQWYDTEKVTLERTFDVVKSLIDDQRTMNKMTIARDKTTLNLTINFTHHDYEWSIIFPCDFPRGSVKLKKNSRLYRAYSSSVEGLGNISAFKNNLESTLQDQCTKCKHMVSYSRQERPEGHSRSRGEAVTVQWYDIQPTTLTRTVDFVTSLADGKRTPKISRDQSTNNIAMEFKHHNHDWEVEFPPNFPTGNVKLKTKVKGSTDAYTWSKASTSYSYRNPIPLSHNVEARGDVNTFMKKLKSVLHNNCTKCTNDRKYEQNNRYARNI